MHKSITIACAVAVSALSGYGVANAADDTIKIGFFATLEGTYTSLGEDGQRGFDLALKQHHNMAGGKKLEIVRGSSDASPDSAMRAARKLVEQDKVDILIAPLSGAEGIALHDYAKTQPQVTFINGCSAALETTYVNPAPNFFRFNLDGAQIHKGLGEYIYNVKHYQKIATIAEDYAFTYTQVFGLALDYCPLGGQITKRLWVPLGTKDFASYIPQLLSEDVDAIYLGLGGADALNFLNQYQQAGGHAKLIGGSIMIDQTVLGSKGKAKETLIGVPSATHWADTWDDPRWQAFVKAFQEASPKERPGFCAVNYYDETTAALLALDKVKGDLSDGHKKFREALASLVLDAPNGQIKLDENRQAIGTVFVTEVIKDPHGDLVNKVVKIVPNVDERLGLSKAAFDRIGLPGREVPICKKVYD
jgi:branched-chain amino acid transport system substrate-binding protein